MVARESGRRVFEPRNGFDRVLYALMAIAAPYTAVAAARMDFTFGTLVMAMWSAITGFYTLEWVALSYRRWRGKAHA